MWVAKDNNTPLNVCRLFEEKPIRFEEDNKKYSHWIINGKSNSDRNWMYIKNFANIKWEDEPIEVELFSEEDKERLNRKVASIKYSDKVVIEEYARLEDYTPIPEPIRFYLSKQTYNDNYYKIIYQCAMRRSVVIIFEYYKENGLLCAGKETNDIAVGQIMIDCPATLIEIWNNQLKNIYVGSKR